jgi:hypothetical protein
VRRVRDARNPWNPSLFNPDLCVLVPQDGLLASPRTTKKLGWPDVDIAAVAMEAISDVCPCDSKLGITTYYVVSQQALHLFQ